MTQPGADFFSVLRRMSSWPKVQRSGRNLGGDLAQECPILALADIHQSSNLCLHSGGKADVALEGSNVR